MISKYTFRKLTWIDIESPTRDEVSSLMETYKLPELLADELMTETMRSKVDIYPNAIYLILHFPTITRGKNKKQGVVEQEIDFIIGKDFIITTHYQTVDPLHEFSKMFEVNSILDKSTMGDHAGYLFYYIIKELYRHSTIQLEDINHTLRDIEKNIFEGHENAMVSAISNVNRILVDYKQTIRFHREVLRSFESAGTHFFGNDFSYYLSAISGEFNKVENELSGHKEILTDLRETNDSLLTTKTNSIMAKLTVMNFILLPLGLIAWILAMHGVNFVIEGPEDFFAVLVAMGAIGVTLFLYFKSRRWF